MDSAFKPTLLLISGRAIGFVAAFFIPVVLVRIFDQAEFGTYKQLFLVYSTLFAIMQFGMAESLFYFLPLAPKKAGRYVLNSMLFLAAAGVACFGLLLMSGSQIPQWLSNGELSALIAPLGVYIVLMMASATLEIVMIARNRHLGASISYALSDWMRALAFVVPVILFRRLEWLLLGAIAFALLRLCAHLLYLRYEFGAELRPDTVLLKRQLVYTLPFGLGVPLGIFQSNFHQYAVSYYFDAATFAIYAVGCLQIPFVDFVASSAGNVMMVRMSEKIRDCLAEAVPLIWHDTTSKLALVLFPIVGLALLVAHELVVFLFTETYSASVPIFMIWSTAILFSAIQTDGVIRVYARTRFAFALSLVKFLLIVTLINWFLSVFHLAGAALVTIMVVFVDKVLALAKIKSLMRVGLYRLLPWRRLAAIFAAASAASLPAWILKSEVEIPVVPLLLVTSLIYTGCYLALLRWMGVLEGGKRLAVPTMSEKVESGRNHSGRAQSKVALGREVSS
jgi:O-antigen/teichoic acid export membrane protein